MHLINASFQKQIFTNFTDIYDYSGHEFCGNSMPEFNFAD